MAKRKQKVTEDTLVYINDLKGTIDFLAEHLAEIEDLLGLNELTPSSLTTPAIARVFSLV